MPKSAAVAVCPDSAVGDSPVMYWLRVVINGISPLIWRRLLVPATATIAQLHTIVRTAFGGGGEHLHRFVIHGAEYGISYSGGPGFRDDARMVRLGELGLRAGERFTYEYNFTAGWLTELRVERIQPVEPGRVRPRCTGGRRAGPPEEWDGSWAFLEQTQPYLVFDAIVRAAGEDQHRNRNALLTPSVQVSRGAPEAWVLLSGGIRASGHGIGQDHVGIRESCPGA